MIAFLCMLAATLDSPEIQLPLVPVFVDPDREIGPPSPKVVDRLAADEWYVITSNVRLIVLCSPDSMVTVSEDVGPIKFRGRFADGNGTVETREYEQDYVYAVEAAVKGKAELIIIPSGVADADEIIRQTLTISGGGPRPPPDDEEEEEEDPDPPPVVTVEHVEIAVVEDAIKRTPAAASLLNNLVAWNQLKDQGHDWRLYDVATTEPKGLAAKAVLKSTIPGIVIRDRKTGDVVHSGELPATIADLQALVEKLTGGGSG